MGTLDGRVVADDEEDAMDRCGQCGRKLRDGGTTTATGRRLCPSCSDELAGAVLGNLGGTDPVPTALALGYARRPGASDGILGWIRRALRRRQS